MRGYGKPTSRLDMKALSRISTYGVKRGLKGDAVWLVIGVISWLLLREKSRLLRPVWRGKVRAGEKIEVNVLSPHVRN